MTFDPDDTTPLAKTLGRVMAKVQADPLPEAVTQAHSLAERNAERALRWQQRIPPRLAHADLDEVDCGVAEDVEQWCATPRGRNLLLFGPVGVGKTYTGIGALRYRHDRGDSVRFWPVSSLLDELRPGGGDRALEEAVGTDVIMLDDLGTERTTDWTYERLYIVVNERWLRERPTVVTTNIAPDALCTAAGERIYSRLVDGDAVMLTLDGPDRRRT